MIEEISRGNVRNNIVHVTRRQRSKGEVNQKRKLTSICGTPQKPLKFFHPELGIVLGILRLGTVGSKLGHSISPLLHGTVVAGLNTP